MNISRKDLICIIICLACLLADSVFTLSPWTEIVVMAIGLIAAIICIIDLIKVGFKQTWKK